MQYKLFCVSDTHGSIPPSPVENVSACLHAGDFYNRGTKKCRILYGEKRDTLSAWAEMEKPPYFSVRGNHDGNDEVGFFSAHSTEITGGAARIADDLIVVGVGWNGSNFCDLPNEADLGVYCNMAMDDIHRKAKTNDSFILVSHYPPWIPKIFPNMNKPLGWMLDCVKELADKIKPIAIITGHIHELAGQVAIYSGESHSSLLVFPGAKGGILTVDTELMTAGFIPNSP